MWFLALFLISLMFLWIIIWDFKWRNPRCSGKLPPGSMGLPLLGETIQFLRPHSSYDIPPFFKDRMRRYGSLFKTNLVGRPVIVSTDPDFCHFIFHQEGISVEPWYLDSFMKLLGDQKLTTSTGSVHKYLRTMVGDHFNPHKQKKVLLLELEDMARSNLAIWCKQDSVEVKEVVTTMSFGLASTKLLSYDPMNNSDNLIDKFRSFMKALISFPLYIPGTVFHKCLKDKKRGLRIIEDIVKERLESGKQRGDFVDVVIREIKKDEPLFNVETAAYFLFAILFASFETVSMALTLAINFLSENPSALSDLTHEHEKILRNKETVDSPLTWDDYKSMIFTSHVLDETLRLSNMVPINSRRATRDILVNGYTIPSGWTIIACPPAVHLNPETYEDSLAFNPWRWKGKGSNTTSKNFMSFGEGIRLCAGADFAKVQMSVVLHFLVTKYRWTKIKGGEIVKTPGISFPNGLHIKVTENQV